MKTAGFAVCIVALIGCALFASAAWCAGDVVGAVYRADVPFPQYAVGWTEGWSAKDADGEPIRRPSDVMPLGGYLFLYYRNSDSEPLEAKDVLLDGVSLTEAIPFSKKEHGGYHAAGIRLSKLHNDQIEKVIAAGEPVWWRVEPEVVEPGAFGQVVVRLRRTPKARSVKLTIVGGKEPIAVKATIGRPQPEFADACFSADMKTVYLYARRASKSGAAPVRILIDGVDVTPRSTTASDKLTAISPIVVRLSEPLLPSSYHCFQAIYKDGSQAIGGLRAWSSEMVYGMWGSRGDPKVFLPDWSAHNINTLMGMWSGPYADFFASKECREFMASLGMRQMATWFGNASKPLYFFLQDEPDAQDFGYDELPIFERLGCLGNALVEKSNELRAKDATVPHLLNLDNTYKPINWYTYAQLADIPACDPYFGAPMGKVSMASPEEIAFNIKPTCVYASAAILQSARAPKPLHVLLLSTADRAEDGTVKTRFPTGEEKRIEAFYALGAGAKGISYWWFTPESGCGSSHPDAGAMYNEIGLIGAELRTAGDVITRSTPIELPVKADRRLWVRTLAAGLDTVVLLVVNDDIVCDRVGTAAVPVEKAKIDLTLPSWLKPASAFEVTCEGTRDIAWAPSAEAVALDLGTVKLTRMIVITSDKSLRAGMQALYERKFAANVAKLKAER